MFEYSDKQLVSRYLMSEVSTQYAKSNKTSVKKISQSAQKSFMSNDKRRTVQMKRQTAQKVVFQSKPIAIFNYNQHFFAMQPMKSEQITKTSEPNRSHNKMMPVGLNSWVSNNKRLQKKWLAGKRGISVDESMLKTKKIDKVTTFENNGDVVHDLKEYFQSMKHYLVGVSIFQKNNKKKVENQRRGKMAQMWQTKTTFEDENNLNIIRLKPNTQQNKRETVAQIQSFVTYQETCPVITQYRSSSNFQKKELARVEMGDSLNNSRVNKTVKSQIKIFKRKIVKKQDFYNIFGKIRQNITDEQLQKSKYVSYSVKILYYRDFLWKLSFNRGFMYEPTGQVYRYYVGKGNNSRLIRKIMGKRSWWVQETKIENAHFIWTQLKVYDSYKNQRSCKPQIMEQSKFITDLKDSAELDIERQSNSKKQQIQLNQNNDRNKFILNSKKYEQWRSYIKFRSGVQKKPHQDMRQRTLLKMQIIKPIVPKMTNHLQFSRVIGNKKALYRTMQAYFSYTGGESYLPQTFHITGGLQDQEYLRFLREFYKKSKEGHNMWIVKPGELSNRGRDIKYCCKLKEIKDQIKERKTNSNGSPRTYIVQSYLEKPYLYQNRKFDLRHYLMVTSTQGKIRGYFYQQGYVRTTSFNYSLTNHNPGVHLTNDAVQKFLPQYGKYQKANKLSYDQLDQFMIKQDPNKGFYDVVFPQLRSIGREIIHAAFPFIDPERRVNNFQIFGIDVMIDSDCNCWLIQVNSNPCIEVNCSVLAAIIPKMLDNAFAIGLDSIIAPPLGKAKISQMNYVEQNKFQLVFDEQVQGLDILKAYSQRNIDIGKFGDDDDNYESCQQQDYQA